MIHFLLWYLAITLLGIAAFPLAYRLLPALPDRGYAFARILGLLVWGFTFWLLGSYHVLSNDLGGEFLAFLLLAALGIYALLKTGALNFRRWFSQNRRMVIAVEVLFLAAFALWTWMRSVTPEIFGTEKPMDMAFVNAILRSPGFPANDPWLSGYAISYYYFGHVLVAMLARLASTPGPIAFNLAAALVFALTAVGAYGLVYNLLARSREEDRLTDKSDQESNPQTSSPVTETLLSGTQSPAASPLLTPLLGPLFVLLVSNLEGFLELLHARGLFWSGGQSAFWSWLGITDLNTPPTAPPSWTPPQFGTGGWWWWRASRVIMDYNAGGRFMGDVINEFPFFSYLLADLHPHVLAMPFFLLAVALALNLFLGGAQGVTRIWMLSLPLNPPAFLLAAVTTGALGFLNTWDFPVAAVLIAGALVLRSFLLHEDGFSVKSLAKDFFKLTIALGVAGVVLYLPFFISFSSQAGGLLPNLVFATRGAQLWVHFAPLLVPVFAFLVFWHVKRREQTSLRKGILLAAGIMLALWLLSMLLTLLVMALPALRGINPLAEGAAAQFLARQGAASWGELFSASLRIRLTNLGGWLTLFALLALTLSILLAKVKRSSISGHEYDSDQLSVVSDQSPGFPAKDSSKRTLFADNCSLITDHFALLLVLLPTLLVFALEFVYLRDLFYYRINSIFKFYFQAWMLWGIAAAYGVAVLSRRLRGVGKAAYTAAVAALIAACLVYPGYAFAERIGWATGGRELTLNGAQYIERAAPDEYAAIQWLLNAPRGNIVESTSLPGTGGQYWNPLEWARVSVFSGLPTVIGWAGHEHQWRGGFEETGSRQEDVMRLYTTRSWEEAREILETYNVRYVVVGSRERSTYPNLYEAKFEQYLQPAFQSGRMTVYQVPSWQPETLTGVRSSP